MARIRTIKPDFFRHVGLYEAEQESGLPLRIAFAGLWTSCDKEGRFKWSPRELKLDCLPYDDVDFSRVLDALATRGFIVKYACESGNLYGFVPSWKNHQVINNREAESRIPEPSDACITRASRVPDATQGEGKGREGERKGIYKKEVTIVTSKKAPENCFDEFWALYPKQRAGSKDKAKAAYLKAITRESEGAIINGARIYAASEEVKRGFAKGAAAWLNDDRWTADYSQTRTSQAKPSASDAWASAFARAVGVDIENRGGGLAPEELDDWRGYTVDH